MASPGYSSVLIMWWLPSPKTNNLRWRQAEADLFIALRKSHRINTTTFCSIEVSC